MKFAISLSVNRVILWRLDLIAIVYSIRYVEPFFVHGKELVGTIWPPGPRDGSPKAKTEAMVNKKTEARSRQKKKKKRKRSFSVLELSTVDYFLFSL